MDTDATRFRVLLAEDDPVSAEFLTEALRACGADVTACADGNMALQLAATQAFELLVLDQQLPGRNGDAVLHALRANAAAASHAAPALATSAEPGAVTTILSHAGFSGILPKPMSLDDLRGALQRQGLAVPATPTLDDAEAERACGSATVATRLRRLFADEELPRLQAELAHNTDPQTLRATLHRLRASCGFCGAPLLAEASANLQRVLASSAGSPEIASSIEAFRRALALTREALCVTPVHHA